MNNRDKPVGAMIGVAALAAAGVFYGCADLSLTRHPGQTAAGRPNGPDWANRSTDMLIDKYGPPDRSDTKRLVWEKKGPWKRILVWDDMGFSRSGLGQDDNIEEVLAYLVPAEKRPLLKEFSARVMLSDDGAQLSARSVSEARNFLALNLADEIIRGVKTPAEAKAFETSTLQRADAGESSPYMRGLLFQPPALP